MFLEKDQKIYFRKLHQYFPEIFEKGDQDEVYVSDGEEKGKHGENGTKSRETIEENLKSSNEGKGTSVVPSFLCSATDPGNAIQISPSLFD